MTTHTDNKKERCTQCKLEGNTGVCDRKDCAGYISNPSEEIKQHIKDAFSTPNTKANMGGDWKRWVKVLSNSKNPHDTNLLIAKIEVLLSENTRMVSKQNYEKAVRDVIGVIKDCPDDWDKWRIIGKIDHDLFSDL